MTKERAPLGFGDELEEFNPAEWTPKPATNANVKPDVAAARKAAEASGFRSREPKPAPVPAEPGAGQGSAPRRRRTGRNAQFNLKARPETIEAFVAIADRQGWGLGETLEHAVSLLEREYAGRN
jgi:hypothetical protein